MPKIDNDETKHTAQPFLIIAQKRSGGTYLTHCLSNHPRVFCDRGESMHHLAIWRKHLEAVDVLHVLTHQEGYNSSGFRMVYSQAFDKALWPLITDVIKPKIIWLTRANKLRQGVSICVNRMIRMKELPYHPVHSFKYHEPPRFTVAPKRILKTCRSVVRGDSVAGKRIIRSGLDHLPLTYSELVGGEGNTQRCLAEPAIVKLCSFLGMNTYPLCCDLVRVHAHPLRIMFDNWNEIESAVSDSEFAKWLEDESRWHYEDGQWQTL